MGMGAHTRRFGLRGIRAFLAQGELQQMAEKFGPANG